MENDHTGIFNIQLYILTCRTQSWWFCFLQHLNLQYVLCHAVLDPFVCMDCPLLTILLKYSVTLYQTLLFLCLFHLVESEQRARVTPVPLHRHRLSEKTQTQVGRFRREFEELPKWTELNEYVCAQVCFCMSDQNVL